ncbi:MAG: TIGR04283 family arsenosugar biosynthesis glycosyltransferase [Gammaproteobacteria bacterium]
MAEIPAASVSVVMPVLNEAAALPAALAALTSWRAAGTEIIVADGGSTDASAAIAAEAADCIIAPRGRARQMNAAAAHAKGDILLFLHADTRLPSDALTAVRAARAHGARWGFFALAIEGSHPMLRVVARLATWRSRLSHIATGDQAIFVARELFAEIGGFPDIPLMEDIALSRRLRARSRPARLRLHATTSGRRWERYGAARTIFLMWRLRLAYAIGVAPERLARRYDEVRARSKSCPPR